MQMTWQVKQVYPTLAWQPLNRKKWGIILFDLSAAGAGAVVAALSKNYSPAVATTHAGYYNQSAKRLAQGLQIFWPWLLSSRTFRPLLFLFGLALILGNFLGYFYLDIWLLWILHMLLCIQGIFSFFFLKQTLVPWLCVLIQRIVYHAMLLHYNHIVYPATT